MVVNKKLTDRSDISIKAENTDQFANKWIVIEIAANSICLCYSALSGSSNWHPLQ